MMMKNIIVDKDLTQAAPYAACRNLTIAYDELKEIIMETTEKEKMKNFMEISNEKNEKEAVNHPNHYNREGSMECIDEMELVFGKQAVMNFCLCNAWKYRYRAADKNGAEDLKKSDWYMRKYKELAFHESHQSYCVEKCCDNTAPIINF